MRLERLKEYERAGELLAQSKLCGAVNPAAGAMILAMCDDEGMSLLRFLERFHVIPTTMKTEVSRKAEAMLADYQELGGKLEVLERSPERCAARLTYGGATHISEVLWSDIQGESYTRNGKGQLKDNWSTPRRRMQMMWARCLSDGLRTVCPASTRGQYTVEEVQDFDGAEAAVSEPRRDEPGEVVPDPVVVAVPVSSPAPAPAPAPVVTDPVVPPTGMPIAPPPVSAPVPDCFAQRGPDGLDYSVCRATGKFKGVPWASVPQDMLRLALAVSSPDIFEQDRETIRRILEGH